ncbi:MAG: hypothetical protein Kow0010_13220 [Dehalococcoidia bacterium]
MPRLFSDRIQLLRSHHVDWLPAGRNLVLVARCCGVRPKHIARALHRSESSIQNEITAAHAAILDPLGLERDVALLTVWVMEHRACCLAAAISLVENSSEITG